MLELLPGCSYVERNDGRRLFSCDFNDMKKNFTEKAMDITDLVRTVVSQWSEVGGPYNAYQRRSLVVVVQYRTRAQINVLVHTTPVLRKLPYSTVHQVPEISEIRL